ncbi:MAG TPA: conjugal transfer protein TraF [Deltaproteobacteria bacterium]|nr:conjugal transfer protein TraF [Deltaproteobacteria bacterium]HOM29754.1 conjugal transfer protein TraF [Deltaproteobacteria bacterium]HPP81539.1 conjugal transfer protein TraF [Deltaproteobacteria bacterium]
MKTSLFVLACMVMMAGAVGAAEYPYVYRGMRPLGMGGAFTAVSDDANALFYNPAGLASIEKVSVSFFPLEFEISENTLDLYGDAMDVDSDSEQEVAEFLRSHMGDRARLAVNLFPHYSMPRFAFGVLGTVRADTEIHDRQYPKAVIHGVNDLGIGAGYAHPLLDETLLLGASAKFIRRQSIMEEYSAVDIASEDFDETIRDDLKDGSGILVDLGMIYKLDNVLLPGLRAGVSASNLVGSKLGDAEDMKSHVDLGLAYVMDLGIGKMTLGADYVDLFSQYSGDDDLAKRIRVGAEWKFPAIASVRAGFHQGYFTCGATIDAWVVRIDALTYAEELGAYAGQRSDRRYTVSLDFGL